MLCLRDMITPVDQTYAGTAEMHAGSRRRVPQATAADRVGPDAARPKRSSRSFEEWLGDLSRVLDRGSRTRAMAGEDRGQAPV